MLDERDPFDDILDDAGVGSASVDPSAAVAETNGHGGLPAGLLDAPAVADEAPSAGDWRALIGEKGVPQPAADAEPDTADPVSHWQLLPLLLGPEGDAYRMLMVDAPGLLVALADSSASPGGLPELWNLPDAETDPAGRAVGIWRNRIEEQVAVLGAANQLGRQWAFDEYQASDKAARESAVLRKRLDYLASATVRKVYAAVLTMPSILSLADKAGRNRPPLRVCFVNDLNATGRYMGMANGVLDLDQQAVLTGQAAADTLTTRSTGVPYRPDVAVRHPDADAIWNTFTLDRELLEYRNQAYAWGLRGKPAQAVYLLTDAGGGSGGGGKTTFLKACARTQGSYGGALDTDVFQGKTKKTGGSRPTPELEALMYYRTGYIEEANQDVVNSERYKSITGGGEITWRRLYGGEQRGTPQCTIWAAANQGLRIDLSGGAELRRYCPIPMPSIAPEQRDQRLETAFDSDTPGSAERKEALLRLMLDTYWGLTRAPEPPQAVLDLAEDHRMASLGTAGEWAVSHLVKADRASANDPAKRVSTKDAYAVFAEMEPKAARTCSQRTLTLTAGKILDLQSKKLRVGGGKSTQGWQGVTLSDEAAQVLLRLSGGLQTAAGL